VSGIGCRTTKTNVDAGFFVPVPLHNSPSPYTRHPFTNRINTIIFPHSHSEPGSWQGLNMLGNKPDTAKKVSDVDHLAGLEEEINRTDRMIQMKVAMNYLAQLIDPKYRQAFEEAERSAKSIEEMNRIIELAKKFIAQRTVVDLLGIE